MSLSNRKRMSRNAEKPQTNRLFQEQPELGTSDPMAQLLKANLKLTFKVSGEFKSNEDINPASEDSRQCS